MTKNPVRREDISTEWTATEPESGAATSGVAADAKTKKQARARPAASGADYEALMTASGASERRAIETATKTAAALGSVASWIERAQEQLTESSRAASRAQDGAASVLADAVGSLGHRLDEIGRKVDQAEPEAVQTALKAIERIETRLSAKPEPLAAGAPDFDAALRSFESRIGELNERIASVPRPIGRRGLTPATEVQDAVAEIRLHQNHLETGTEGDRASLPALGTLARSQTAILTTLRADITKLAGRIDANGAESKAGSDALRGEVDIIRDSVASAATRDDLDRLEQAIRSLTVDIAEMRVAEQKVSISGEMETLQAEIRRLADSNLSAGRPGSREIDVLSHKLDIVAASGVDPEIIGSLTRQVEQVRDLLTGAAAPQALSLVSTHLADLRREVAEVGGRQVDPAEFTSLKSTVDEMRAALASPGLLSGAPGRDMADAIRGVGQPIEMLLAAVVDKLERVEQRVSDTDAMDHLERQIQDLAARIGEPTGSDPAVSGLERSMGELLSEVSTWRESAMEAAEHAARTAVVEALGSMPQGGDVDGHLAALRDHHAATEQRTHHSLAAVNATLEEVMNRITSLETGPVDPPQAITPRSETGVVVPQADLRAPRQPVERSIAETGPAEANQPLPTAPEDEILLEPGAGRPGAPSRAEGEERVSVDPANIKSSFIAAARRAAQAAAAEASAPKKKSSGAPEAASRLAAFNPAELARRLRRMIDERRRPLLLSAAALVLAIGTVQVVRSTMEPDLLSASDPAPALKLSSAPSPTSTSVMPAGVSVGPSPIATSRLDSSDPITTQSIGAKPASSAPDVAQLTEAPAGLNPVAVANREEATPPAVTAVPDREPAKTDAAGGSAAAISSTTPPAAQRGIPAVPAPQGTTRAHAGPEPAAALPVGIKHAAALGDPIALYELASRTADGRGVTRDPKAAAGLFEKAAEKGLAPAQFRAGNLYEKGVGVTRDLAAAKLWYRRGAENGNTRSMHNLAVLIAEGGGAKPDYASAIAWFTRAAEHGVRDSQFNLAVLYARGLGTDQNLSKSYEWLALAAAQGDVDAGRKRDEVAARLPAADLARAKAAGERWRAKAADPAANEVQVPAAGWPDSPVKRAGRESRA